MEVKTIKDVLDYIDCGIVNNNYNTNYIEYMEMIHSFLLKTEKYIQSICLNYFNSQTI